MPVVGRGVPFFVVVVGGEGLLDHRLAQGAEGDDNRRINVQQRGYSVLIISFSGEDFIVVIVL